MNTMNAEGDKGVRGVSLTPEEWRVLRRIKTAARLSLGLVWVWEGLMPKVLFPSALDIEMVRRSGWWWGSPEQTLCWLGWVMIPAGLAIMSGVWERAAVLVASLSVLVLMVLVISTNPAALHDPFGGLVKDGCLFTCAALVWWWPRGKSGTEKAPFRQDLSASSGRAAQGHEPVEWES